MILKTDRNNRDAVTAVDWFVNDFPNQQNIMLPIHSQIPMTSVPLCTSHQKHKMNRQNLIPFVAFQLNLVGAQFASGAGRITYESTDPLMVANTTASLPCDNLETPSRFTGETGNVVYGQPTGTGNTLTQTFEVIT